MTFTLWLLLWFCGVTLAQDGFPQTEVATETGSCFPDMCKFLKEFGAMKEKQEAMETRQKETENQVLELKKKDASNIAFSAATGGYGHTEPFSTDTTLIYRRVIVNVGNAYNQHTGIFAAPVPGIYYFTFFYHAGGSQLVNLTLMKNNEIVVTVYDHKSSHDGADNGGNAAFLQLQQGDQVYVRMSANSHVWQNDYITTFSGALLRPQDFTFLQRCGGTLCPTRLFDYNIAPTGVFVAPVRGIYYFSFFYHASGLHPSNLHLMKNSEIVVLSSDQQTSNDGSDNGGNAAVLELQQGDQVYLQLVANNHVWGNNYHTTFSGFLLHQV
ncbi:uncharacterized protein LOC129378290 [Poeciliopsis prolifica]|uniref:uncharacterized protein LOC129378290 n=1 Tax=Poeciliopsis prolifica TaxID=188132 RepID=UPI0024141600|nr:uncharacterized protein LOC129378290 [Poeciliopsis prolifica]